MTIGKKLFVGIGLLVVLTLALGLTALESMFRIGTAVDTTLARSVHKLTLAHTIDRANSDLMSDIRGIMLRGFLKDKPAIEAYRRSFAETHHELSASVGELSSLVHNEHAKEALREIQTGTNGLQEAEESLSRSALAGDMEQAGDVNQDKVLPSFKNIKAQSLILLKVQNDILADDSANARESIVTSTWMTAVMVVLSCLVAVVLIIVVKGINGVLRETVVELAEASLHIADASGHVAHASQQLAQGASEQAGTIEQTSTATAEIQAMAKQAADSSHATAIIVGHTQESFVETNRSLTDLVSAMEGIDESSQKISQIIKVIDGIAFQTNILALNAAVEAARAGEAGMGFAVVADEVRSLAQRSAQAAKDTSALIEESIERSHRGREKVDHVAVAVRGVTGESDKISQLVDQINRGSSEQSLGIDSITRSIAELEQVTQSNAAGAEEGASAADELNTQAANLREVVERLRLMVDGVGYMPEYVAGTGRRIRFHATAPA